MSQAHDLSLLHINGVDGATGNYDIAPFDPKRLTELLAGSSVPSNFGELKTRARSNESHYGVKASVDPERLDQAGWGVIFPASFSPAIVEALTPLLDFRRQQAGDRFRIFSGEKGIQPGETKSAWLARHGVAPGPADPELMPYYLMLVGDPEQIPFSFQYQLDVQYAVGRLDLDNPQAYASYAETVLASERGEIQHERRATFLGVENADDRATQLSNQLLVQPLTDTLTRRFGNWQMTSFTGADAVKSKIMAELSDRPPALLFSASHGMSFPSGDPRQAVHMGALLCGEWPGPKNWREAIPQDFYLAGDDLVSSQGLYGMMAFCHACFGAGVPPLDNFSLQLMRARKALAPKPFVAELPRHMLSHPKGGALAVIGHVDRAWSYSFEWPDAGRQTAVYESALTCIMEGKPVGMAMEYFNMRYAELATSLTEELEEIEFGKIPNHTELTSIWTAHNDARTYVVLGDPAVRLFTGQPSQTKSASAPIQLNDRPAVLPTASQTQAPKPEPAQAQVQQQSQEPRPQEQLQSDLSESGAKTAPLDAELSEFTKAWLDRLDTALRSLDKIEVQTHLGEPGSAPFAHTRVELDGTVVVVLANEENEQAWRKHQETVKLAMENRTTLLTEVSRILLDRSAT